MIPQAATTLVRPLIAITLTAAFSRRGRHNGINPRFLPTNTIYLSVIFRSLQVNDDGKLTPVGVGDVVVQNGTSHAWRNLTDMPATVIVVLIGAAHD